MRSKPIEHILAEARELASDGAVELNLRLHFRLEISVTLQECEQRLLRLLNIDG
jgi:hypothetical protein